MCCWKQQSLHIPWWDGLTVQNHFCVSNCKECIGLHAVSGHYLYATFHAFNWHEMHEKKTMVARFSIICNHVKFVTWHCDVTWTQCICINTSYWAIVLLMKIRYLLYGPYRGCAAPKGQFLSPDSSTNCILLAKIHYPRECLSSEVLIYNTFFTKITRNCHFGDTFSSVSGKILLTREYLG